MDKKMMNRRIIVGVVIGLAIGLVLGIFLSVIFILPIYVHQETEITNPVKVSGSVSFAQYGTIQFINWNETTNTRYDHYSQIIFGRYSITLSGGHNYTVIFGLGGTEEYPEEFRVYVPSNVTTFTANF